MRNLKNMIQMNVFIKPKHTDRLKRMNLRLQQQWGAEDGGTVS